MRTLRAFAWLRWRLLVNSLRSGQRRDTMEQISRTLTLMLPIAIAALSVGSLIALAVLGFIGGRAMGAGAIEPSRVMAVVRAALAVMTGIVVVFAVSSPVQSSLTRYTRLLLLPIPRRTLHLAEIGAALVDPWIVLIVPGLVLFVAGLAAGGRLDVAMAAAAAGVCFIAVLACLSSAAGFAVAWLFRSRRRSEMLTLVAVLGISLLSIVPAFFSRTIQERKQGAAGGEQRVETDLRRMLGWTRALPSQLYGDVVRATFDRRTGDVGVALALVGGEAILFFAISSAVHRRLIGSVEGRSSRRRIGEAAGLTPVLPYVTGGASAVAAAQFRTGLRSVRGRLVVMLPGPMLAILTLAFRAIPDEMPMLAVAARHGYLLLGAGAFFSLYALQAFSMNLFGSDRAGLTQQFLAPVSDADLARGKVAGVGLMFGVAVGLCVISALLVAPTGSPALWLATILGGAATFAVMSPVMVWMSAIFPVASDLSKSGGGGNPHGVPMFFGILFSAIAAAPAAGIIFAAQSWWQRPWTGLAMMALWLVIAATVAAPFVAWASRAITLRRENLGLVAQGR